MFCDTVIFSAVEQKATIQKIKYFKMAAPKLRRVLFILKAFKIISGSPRSSGWTLLASLSIFLKAITIRDLMTKDLKKEEVNTTLCVLDLLLSYLDLQMNPGWISSTSFILTLYILIHILN